MTGIHAFAHKNIFEAVYCTNLLMRSCDVIVTKPSELAFYPVPKLFIKRVIGLPGDVIDIHDGQVSINGEKDDQGYTRDGVTDEPDGDLKAHKVPEGTIFCLGDNRLNSMDSRYAGVGDVSMERVTGKVVMRIYPFGRFGTLRNPYER